MLKLMIVGATSTIAHETARNFAADGAHMFLVARNNAKLDAVAADLRARGAAQVVCTTLDMNDFEQHASLWQQATDALEGLDVLLVAHGTLPDQTLAQQDWESTRQALDTNFLSTASLLTIAANHFEQQKRGVIAVISSVAGDRGRGSNYIYGTAQAAKTTFLSGLRNRLAKSGVQVITIKPGFVDTPMTQDVPKNALFASPSKVGQDIYQAMKSGKSVIYTPFYWRYIMMMIRAVPEAIFKRLNL